MEREKLEKLKQKAEKEKLEKEKESADKVCIAMVSTLLSCLTVQLMLYFILFVFCMLRIKIINPLCMCETPLFKVKIRDKENAAANTNSLAMMASRADFSSGHCNLKHNVDKLTKEPVFLS